ncbi:NAD(P)-dependent oxidoreductase [Pedobacter sp. SYSU D00535]|uniref:NAD(P)-dependent oxidoreductase n=1 Tax=Pedobacter sp. SYSU D00535 TaxID=2810308 RepID=UPI001A95F446|nr:NAD(P)-dependent oxidoreductase [Pedobacter sp. SYSU D00535]
MKIALIGASGFVGSAILKEASERGHQVTAISRNPKEINATLSNVTAVQADIFKAEELVEVLRGHDAVISAYNPGWSNPNIYKEFLQGYASIQDAVKQSGVKRFIVIGGAGSLEIAPGVQAVDQPDFPAAIKPGATAARDYLNILKEEKELEWTFFSPAFEMHQGTSGVRRGTYRKGLDNPVFDEEGRSVLSVEDLALAIIDELEQGNHIRQRFTAAY